MQAVKAVYRHGRIQLLEPLTDIEDAELLVIVLDREGKTGIPASIFQATAKDSEQDFQALGMAGFVATDDDSDVDWEQAFDVKAR